MPPDAPLSQASGATRMASRGGSVLGPSPGQSAPPGTAIYRTPDVRAAENSAATSVGMLTYDAFIRAYVYDPAAKALTAQAQALVNQGLMTRKAAADWVVAQRNALLINVRDEKNTPLGRAYAEYLKPRDKLPTAASLIQKQQLRNPEATSEQIFDAIIQSGSRTRASVNRLSLTLRFAGTALVAVDVAFSAYLVIEAPANQRARVAAREAGGLGLGTVGGWAGAKFGCEAGAAIGVWFEGVGAVPGCFVGSVVGGLGLGYAGSRVGASLGEWTFDEANTVVEWVEH